MAVGQTCAQNGALVNGTKDSNLRFSDGPILTHTLKIRGHQARGDTCPTGLKRPPPPPPPPPPPIFDFTWAAVGLSASRPERQRIPSGHAEAAVAISFTKVPLGLTKLT